VVVGRLRDHFGAGRLTQEELDERLDAVYSSTTRAELEALVADLPDAEAPAPPARRPAAGARLPPSVRIHLWIYVLVNVLLVGIWAASGAGYFWPVWSMLGWGIGVAAHAAPALAGVERRRRRRRLPAGGAGEIERIAAEVGPRDPSLRAAAAPDGTVTILFSDVCGSTELNERLGDLRWLEVLRVHHEVIREQVRAHGGFEVKAQGDGFMVAFPSARRALLCAAAIQRAIQGLEGPLRVRIGVHTGEAISEGDDYYGRNVVLAARLTERAGPGEILASSIVKSLTESAGDIAFSEAREVELKGLGPHTAYAVRAG
jgi:class 3 adenylate cyclase